MNKGKIYLIPTPISNIEMKDILLPMYMGIVEDLTYHIAESAKKARANLMSLDLKCKIQDIEIVEFNEHSKDSEIKNLLEPIFSGKDIGLLSDSGIPSVADPAFRIVRIAQELDIQVKPLVGPSSILLALEASGLNGQSFSFVGYLPKEREEKRKRLKLLEDLCYKINQTQIFMEPPYRNNSLFLDILNTCKPYTKVCVAYDIMGVEENITTKSIDQWKREKRVIGEKPCLFLINK